MRVDLNELLDEIGKRPNAKKRAEIRELLPHFTGFTLSGYGKILKALSRKYAVVPFREYRKARGPRLILRHDIEGFLEPAAEMAKVENRLGVRSTYFVLLSSRLYNPAEKSGFEIISEISQLGHEIGLHYDVSRYMACGRPPRETLDVELRFLGHLLGNKVTAISRHNPSIQSLSNPFSGTTNLMSAYDDEFTVDAHYVSDSCRAWYLEDLLYLLVRDPVRVQLLVHPENWTPSRCERYQTLDMLYQQLDDENQVDKEAWKKDWETSERVPLYEQRLTEALKRLR